ncbi:MAG: hypothetical protein EBE86_015430 [Hormoscilla sp. GUM202]|nr:hypothetical protein [Hormoscilla sp. GUM202]
MSPFSLFRATLPTLSFRLTERAIACSVSQPSYQLPVTSYHFLFAVPRSGCPYGHKPSHAR